MVLLSYFYGIFIFSLVLLPPEFLQRYSQASRQHGNNICATLSRPDGKRSLTLGVYDFNAQQGSIYLPDWVFILFCISCNTHLLYFPFFEQALTYLKLEVFDTANVTFVPVPAITRAEILSTNHQFIRSVSRSTQNLYVIQ